MKKSLIVVAVAAAVTVVIIHQQTKISALQKALAEKPAVEKIVEKVPAPAPRAEVAVTKRAEPPVVAPAAVVPAAPPTAPTAAAAAKPKPNMADFMKNIGSMMTNSAMKEMIRSQAKIQLEMQYGRLFKFLNKTPEQIEALKNILMDRQMALMDSGMSFLDGSLSPEDRKKKAEEIKTVKDSYDKQIAALLGTDDYDAFKQYESTQPERMQVEMFKNTAAASGEPLTDQQEYDLVNAMYSARTNAPAMSAMMMKQDAPPDPAMFTEAGMTNAIAQMNQVQQQYAAAAAAILTPTQNEQYKKFLDQQKAMNEMGMKFAAQMFGGSSNAVPAAVNVQVQVK